MKPLVPISWNLIVRNCGVAAAAAINSLRPILLHPSDEIVVVDTGSTDRTVAHLKRAVDLRCLRILERPDLVDAGMPERMRRLAPAAYERYGRHVQFEGGCLADFAAAREVARLASQNPVIAWLDADDVLEGDLSTLRRELEDFWARGGECFFLRYDYAHDVSDGACTTALWRERFVLRDRYHWAGACHEVLLPNEGFNGALARSETAWIRHVAEHRKEHGFSDLRNLAILQPLVEAAGDPDKADPRWYYYLGNAYRGLEMFDDAARCYELFLPRSGSRDDRALACLHLAQMAAMRGRPWRAIKHYQAVMLVCPDDPRAEFGIQRCYFDLRQWEEVLRWGRLGLAKVPTFHTLNSIDPQQLAALPHYLMSIAARELGRVQEALHHAQLFQAARPRMPGAAEFVQATSQWALGQVHCEAVKRVAAETDSMVCRVQLLQGVRLPPFAPEQGVARPEFDVEGQVDQRDISFFCGHTLEPWGPGATEQGIGGSERMVEEVARRLAARGLRPTIYCRLADPRSEGTDAHGVTWRHYLQFNPLLDRTFVVAWRNPGFFNGPIRARRRYVWLHDITNPAQFDPVTLATLDRVICLSPFHAEPLRARVGDKLFVSRNGIDSAEIRRLASDLRGPRDPRRIVYASSPDRGLHLLLRAKRELPDFALDVCYGFSAHYVECARLNEFVFVNGVARQRFEFMDEILADCEQPGVAYRGRVGKADLLRLLLGSGIFCYPATFDETFCISAAEAQACGCTVLAPRRAALATTLLRSPLIRELTDLSPSAIAAAIRDAAEHPPTPAERAAAATEAQTAFDLDSLVDQWIEELFDARHLQSV